MIDADFGTHVRLVLREANNPHAEKPGDLADATLSALLVRAVDGEPFWSALHNERARLLFAHPDVREFMRTHWRDFLLDYNPIEGTWQAWCWALRSTKRDLRAAQFIASTMASEDDADALVVHVMHRRVRTLWRYRPVYADLAAVVVMLVVAILIVGG